MGLATYDDGLPNTPKHVMGFRFGLQITDRRSSCKSCIRRWMATSCTMAGTSIARRPRLDPQSSVQAIQESDRPVAPHKN